jgi:uroporphyrinogen III methyltransferase / synthase
LAESLGIVHLVGAGPGDPGLITLAGLECLRAAEVVVYDRLVHPALLSEAPDALLIDVGERPDHHPISQDQINELLIEHARAGRVVVRLKGDDPFVFGRGGEEAESLVQSGIPFEVVPGVSSAIAVPAYAGIPLTHRSLACSFSVITGHRKADGDEIACDWQGAAGADTLVFLMGVTALSDIVANLIEVGKSPETPAAVIERGTSSHQRTVTGTLATIAGIAAKAKIKPLVMLVVGDVVSLRESLRWFEATSRRPLRGVRVLNTRSLEDGEELSRLLRELGAEVVSLPATRIVPPDDLAPLDAAIAAIADGSPASPAFDWIGFTSAHAASAFMDRFLGSRGAESVAGSGPDTGQVSYRLDVRALAGTKLAAVGPATAAALQRYGLLADLVPDRAAGRHLAAALGDVFGLRILLPRSDVALRDLPAALEARGASVTEVLAYSTRPAPANYWLLQSALSGDLDVATFFSPSALEGLAAQVAPRPLDGVLGGLTSICVGETTAAAARSRGLSRVLVAEEATTAGVVRTLVRWRRDREDRTEGAE